MWNLVGIVLLSISVQLLDGRPISTVPRSLIGLTEAPVLASKVTPQTDPVAEQAVQTLISTLKQSGYSESQQGVWLQTHDGELLTSRLGTQPLPVASLTKTATTLAALQTWGSNYRFVTTIGTTGQIVGNTLQGDLIVQGSGDPFFVWEEAIALGNALNQMGIRRIQGNLVVTGKFYMNFEQSPQTSAALFKQAMDGGNWSDEVAAQYRTMPSGTAKPQVAISGEIRVLPSLSPNLTNLQPLIRHNSLPLWQILKRMNTFSNNEMAEMLAAELGGSRAVMQAVIDSTGISPQEIYLINGSGLGQQNQISPHATVAILIAVQKKAQLEGLTLADLLPISDCHCGTIDSRNLPAGSLVKTGTLSDVSTLAGVIQTRDRGPIWFAIINRGDGDIDFFHRVQDQVLRTLTLKWGQPKPVLSALFSPTAWQDRDRNEILLMLSPAGFQKHK
ncbi:D-alanyl-D-alanine carboxypeptidase [Tumidithrix elongata RA019]|uniref:D-alanyl-D-alanine carboxypeptidase n=1 Tax=Tumidithrix elongata BACA0141 TaxID=2716417 RepID=A0AAW9Q6Z1_9CYAN|nr:D-alanyl-D-alanine carboxypeptidase [Tumidithrix elongata RA019]